MQAASQQPGLPELPRAWLGTLIAITCLLLPVATPAAAERPVTCAGEPRLVDGPPAETDLRTPPDPDRPTPVRVGLFVEDLRDIDAVQASYRFRGVITISWCDPRLAFDPRVVGLDEQVFFGPAAEAEIERIWTTRGFPVNQVDEIRVTERVVRMRHDGTVSADLNITLRLGADYDLRRFPFDKQRLTLQVESFLWNARQVVFVADDTTTGFADDFQIPEWTIAGVQAHVETVDVIRSSEPFSRLVLAIDIKRKSGFYLWKVLLPLLLIVALSWSVFWMVEEKFGIRVRTSATGVLTVVAYQFVASQDLPRVGYLTLLDKIMVISFVLLAVTVVESYIVSRYQADDPDRARRIDRMARWIFPLGYAGLIGFVFLGAAG